MKLIPAGTNSGSDPDLGAYSLTVSAFFMDAAEVTKAKWDEVRSWGMTNGYTDLPVGGGKAPSHPVQMVSWFDCVKWCNARSQKEGRVPTYYTNSVVSTNIVIAPVYKTGQVVEPYVKTMATGYRLPTEIQWQYAARGGLSGKRYPWGDTITHSQANYSSSSSYAYDTSPTRGVHPTYAIGSFPYTSPTNAFSANGYGLCDMTGNVWEWCYDWFPGKIGTDRVLHGGSWFNTANYGRMVHRLYNSLGSADSSIGFRSVLSAGQP
jgi:formylglycine-generating enzyme required for sulfatase activity